jgi:hypothetical protein
MRRLLFGSLLMAASLQPLHAQRRGATPPLSSAAIKAQVDEFVTTVRDMAAWSVVTPAAHTPVGGIQDTTGNVESVVATQDIRPVPDSVLVAFRHALGTAARKNKSRAIGLAYLVRRPLPGKAEAVDAVLVEVEHRSGYTADVLCPYTRNEFGEPVFGVSYHAVGSLRELAGKRPR